tara:strand:+ start:346 stop:804 length:459 start_codon:yes stop_codon:yes gene_type:complete
MEKIKALNKKHELIIEQFTKCVDRFIYDVTDDQKVNIFNNFIPLKRKAKLLHNTLGNDIEKNDKVSKQEWVFMLPNFLMFGAFGFAMALKNEKNEELMELHVRELYEDMTETIYDLDEMLEKHLIELETIKTIHDIMKDPDKQKTKTKKTKS